MTTKDESHASELATAIRQAIGYLERKPQLIASAYSTLKAALKKHDEAERKA